MFSLLHQVTPCPTCAQLSTKMLASGSAHLPKAFCAGCMLSWWTRFSKCVCRAFILHISWPSLLVLLMYSSESTLSLAKSSWTAKLGKINLLKRHPSLLLIPMVSWNHKSFFCQFGLILFIQVD